MLAEILKLFPGLGVGLVIAWYAVRVLRSIHAAHVANLNDAHAQHTSAKDAMIARLESDVELLRKERDKWLREAMKRDKP